MITDSEYADHDPADLRNTSTPPHAFVAGDGSAVRAVETGVLKVALAVACDIHPLNNSRVLNYLRSPLGLDKDTVNTWYWHWTTAGFRGLEEEARRASGDGQHMFGSAVTIADVCIVPQMYNARRFKCDLEPYPTLRGICAYLERLPAFAKAAPEAQPDAS